MSSVNDLIKAIANRDFEPEFIDSDIQFINERFDSFRKYFNAVYEHVYGGSTALTLVHGGMMSTEKYQDYVMNLDKNRKIMHDRAIDSCAQLNRQCDMYGLEHLCPEVEFDQINNQKCVNRGEIADFVGRYVYSVFQQGREGRTMDQLIIDNEMKYGDRPALDVSYEIAKDAGRNPEHAYNSGDMDQNAYGEFEYKSGVTNDDAGGDSMEDVEYDDDDFGEL